MKLTVVGYWGGFPFQEGASSCYLLEKDGFTLVIDLGSGALSQLQRYIDIPELDAVILSHYHHDHMADVGVLQYARVTYAYVEGLKDILPIYGHVEDKAKFNALTHDFTSGVAYHPKEQLTVGPFQITFLRTEHNVPCFGMRITDGQHTLVYTADTAYKDEWIPFAQEVDLLITDCNFYAKQHEQAERAGHMTSQQGALIAEQAQVKELILSHLPQFGDHQQLLKEAKEVFSGTVHLAKQGFIWEGPTTPSSK